MAIENLHDLFVHTLRDIYFAEQTIVKKLPKMAEKATSAQLRAGFEQHLAETKQHVTRLEQVFERLARRPRQELCRRSRAITEEAETCQGDPDPEPATAMLASAQAVEHYEITRYGTLIAWAEELGLSDAVSQLKTTLAEEKATDQKLTQLAEGRLNRRAAA